MQRFLGLVVDSAEHGRISIPFHTGAEDFFHRGHGFRMDGVEHSLQAREFIFRAEKFRRLLPAAFGLLKIATYGAFAHFQHRSGRQFKFRQAGEMADGEVVGNALPLRRFYKHIQKCGREMPLAVETLIQPPVAGRGKTAVIIE